MSGLRNRLLSGLLAFLLACSAQGEEKPSCAVLTLDALTGVDKAQAALLSDRLTMEIWKTDKYVIIARQKIDNTPDLRLTDQSNTWSAAKGVVELGRTISVQYVVYGSLGHVDSLYTLNTTLVDINSAHVIKTVTTDHRGRFESFLTEALRKNVAQLLSLPEQPDPQVDVNAAVDKEKPPQIRLKNH